MVDAFPQSVLHALGWLAWFISLAVALESRQFLLVAVRSGGGALGGTLGLLASLAAPALAAMALLVLPAPDAGSGTLRVATVVGCMSLAAWQAVRSAAEIVSQGERSIACALASGLLSEQVLLAAPTYSLEALDRLAPELSGPRLEAVETLHRLREVLGSGKSLLPLLAARRRAAAGDRAAQWLLWAWANWRWHTVRMNFDEAYFWRGAYEAAVLTNPEERARVQRDLAWSAHWTSDYAKRRRSAGFTYFNDLQQESEKGGSAWYV